jgi:hypothetical protein
MKLLILFGAPAVGKATVGRHIEAMTTFKLFHNHMIMDGVMHIFGVGTPAEDRLSKRIRTQVIEEAAESELNLIFTYVWNFALEKGKDNIDAYKKIYESHGGEVLFVELIAPLDVRVRRASDPDRLAHKTHAPTADKVTHLDTILNTTSPSPFYYPSSFRQVDTTNKSAKSVAQEIVNLL